LSYKSDIFRDENLASSVIKRVKLLIFYNKFLILIFVWFVDAFSQLREAPMTS